MIYLIGSILVSTSIFIIFKIIEHQQIKILPVIVYNYIVAFVFGMIVNKTDITFAQVLHSDWFWLASLVGVLYIIFFYLIALSTQKVGVAVTTIASRMSVIIPMLFSIFYYHESVGVNKIIGFIVALTAVFMTVYRKRSVKFDMHLIYLPLLIFAGTGTADSLMKLAEGDFIDNSQIPVFSAVVFGAAGVVGIISVFFANVGVKEYLHFKPIVLGTVLGLVNFGTAFFFLNALDKSGYDSSIVFGLNHIGIITLSVLSALVIFKEKISIINKIGIILAIVAIVILTQL